VVKILERGK